MAATTLTVCIYDIAHDGRRNKLHALLRQYGVAVQESAFEARLTRFERTRLLVLVQRLLDVSVDRFVMYTLPHASEEQIATVGLPRPHIEERGYYIV